MPLQKLRRQFEERRLSLIETLQKNKEGLELSQQHQIYGAIKEIENFLKALDYAREEQLRGDTWELKSIEPKMKRTVGHAKERTRVFFSNIGIVLKERVAHPAKRVAHAMRKKVRLVKEVAKEVKARSKEKEE